ncbi:MAG TPA: sulfate adenylyltransferase [Halobacteriales archaeon]|nr:sulfate adenylyltransferase [Halobacteriales archaeon]
MIKPHGGYLIDRTVDRGQYSDWIQREAEDVASIHLNEEQFQDALNIANGRYSPLEGFMNRDDFVKVIEDMTLEDGTVWPVPVLLDVDAETVADVHPGERVGLRNPDGELFGVLNVDEVYKYNGRYAATKLFGTADENHPGVASFHDMDDYLVGGDVSVFDDCHYNENDLLPAESRVLFRHYGWETVVGFQTRNVPHRGHEYIQKTALEQVDGLLVQPKIGEKKSGDYDDEAIINSYRRLIDCYYPDNSVVLSVFPSRMRYAGPREAVFDALVRKNQGCTHFIIGRDHAGVGDFYPKRASHEIFDTVGDIGIEPMRFLYAFYCHECDGMASRKICPHDDESRVYPSGTEIRRKIRQAKRPSEKMMRPEIASFIIDAEEKFVEQ